MIICVDAAFRLIQNDKSVINSVLSNKIFYNKIKKFILEVENNEIKIHIEIEIEEDSEVLISDILNVDLFLGDMIKYIDIKIKKDDYEFNIEEFDQIEVNPKGKPYSYIISESYKSIDNKVNLIRFWGDGENNCDTVFKAVQAKRFPSLVKAVKAFSKNERCPYTVSKKIYDINGEASFATTSARYFVSCYDFNDGKEELISSYALKREEN